MTLHDLIEKASHARPGGGKGQWDWAAQVTTTLQARGLSLRAACEWLVEHGEGKFALAAQDLEACYTAMKGRQARKRQREGARSEVEAAMVRYKSELEWLRGWLATRNITPPKSPY